MSRRHKEEIALMNEKIKFLMETRNGGSESAGSHRREIKVEYFLEKNLFLDNIQKLLFFLDLIQFWVVVLNHWFIAIFY